MRSYLLRQVALVATAHPAAWMYSFVAAGLALGITLYAALGWWIGSLFGAPQATQYLALTWYGWWFTTAIPGIHAHCDTHIALLREAHSLIRE